MTDDKVFGRLYSLTVGRFERLVPKVKENLFENLATKVAYNIPDSIAAPNGYIDFNTLPASFIEFNDNQIVAKIINSKDNTAPASIQLYNLDPEDIKQIKQDDMLILKAGYKQDVTKVQTAVGEGIIQDLPLLFVGQVVRIRTYREEQDMITEIICGDSISVKKNVKVTASWPPGTTRLKVIQDMAKLAAANGVPTGSIQTRNLLPDGKTMGTLNAAYIAGYSVHGFLFEELEKLCEASGMRSYTAVGKLYVEPKQVTRTLEVVRVTPAHIKGNIAPETDNTGKLSGENTNNKTGLTLNLFLNGRIQPNQILSLSGTPDYDGEYQITSVNHELNLRGEVWDTIVSCVKV